MFGLQELATAAQYGIDLVTVVFNNDAYGNVLRDQKRLSDGRSARSCATRTSSPLAQSFGVAGRVARRRRTSSAPRSTPRSRAARRR